MKTDSNLIDLVNEYLQLSESPQKPNTYIAKPIFGSQVLRIAKGLTGTPALLIDAPYYINDADKETIAYKHISFTPKCNCILQSEASLTECTMAVITCTSDDAHLREYFLRSLSGVCSSLPQKPSIGDIYQMLNDLLELFQLKSSAPRDSVQGLWGELLIIYLSSDPEKAIQAWHENPNALYDFYDGVSAVEVKTALGDHRCHHFSILQLNPPENISLVIASLLIQEIANGATVYDLLAKIATEKEISPNALSKAHAIILSILGRDWFEQKNTRFDIVSAGKGLKLFRHHLIPQIRYPLPQGVNSVSFISDLTFVSSLCFRELIQEDGLAFGLFSE